MKPRLNKEYVVRHLGVAALMLGLSGWFLYDGAVKYPKQDDKFFADLHAKRETAIARQYQFSAITFVAAFVIAGLVGLESRKRFDFGKDDVSEIDFAKWDRKRIAYAKLKNGRTVALDAWHFAGVREFLAELGHPAQDDKPAE